MIVYIYHTIVLLASLLEQYAYLLELLSVAIYLYGIHASVCNMHIMHTYSRTFQNNFRYCTPCPMAAHLMTIPTRSSCVRRSAAGGRAARPRFAPSGYLNLFLSLLEQLQHHLFFHTGEYQQQLCKVCIATLQLCIVLQEYVRMDTTSYTMHTTLVRTLVVVDLLQEYLLCIPYYS